MNYLSHSEIQEELFKLLCTFDDYAKELDLRYSLCGGTLLGAVRHKGFIPWDDDIDIMLPRPEYERLSKATLPPPQGFALQGFEKDGAPFPFMKFSNLGIRMQEEVVGDSYEEYLWLDIFPLDGMFDEEEKNKASFNKIRKLVNYRIFQTFPSPHKPLNIVKKPLQFMLNLYKPLSKTIREMNEIAQQVPFEKASWCKNIIWADSPTARMRTADFDKMEDLEFCGRMFPAISNWSDYLTSAYGDYMTIPPEDQRYTHDAKAWHV